MFVSAAEAKLYTTSFGSRQNPTIVGIGGWIGSWELWAEPFSILSETFRTIAYDHRGSGASVAPAQTITNKALIDDLFTVLDAYRVEKCILAAESAGAQTALGAALRSPKRITHLVIVDGLYHVQESQENDPFLQGLEMAYDATLSQFVELCVPESNAEHLKRWGRQIINRASQESAIALRKVSKEVDMRGDLTNISQPTLIIHGEKDNIVPLQDAQNLASFIPKSELVILKDAGHVPTLTRPIEVANAISMFWKNA